MEITTKFPQVKSTYLAPVDELKVRPKDAPPRPPGELYLGNNAFNELCNSLERTGKANMIPVFINDRKEIIDGHYRYWAALRLGWSHVPVLRAETVADATHHFA